MADEETKAAETAGAEKPKKKGKSKLLIIVVLVLLLLGGGGGFVAWKMNLLPIPGSNQVKQKIATKRVEEEKKEMGPVQPLDTFIVNLASEKGERYLKVTMDVELTNEDARAEVEKRSPQLRDSIIILLSSKTFQEIMGADGKGSLKREILARVNSFLSAGKAKRVYFTEFVVQ